MGIDPVRYKLLAFVWSSAVTAVAGALFAYHRGFVSVEAFSFFLAVPTLTGATALQLLKHWDDIPTGQFAWIGLGSLVSFVVAVVVVKAFIAIVTRYGFGPFAWYRIVLGTIAIIGLWYAGG